MKLLILLLFVGCTSKMVIKAKPYSDLTMNPKKGYMKVKENRKWITSKVIRSNDLYLQNNLLDGVKSDNIEIETYYSLGDALMGFLPLSQPRHITVKSVD